MVTIITTIIVSFLLGIISPNASLGVNFPSQNLFSQVISQLPKKALSGVNPMESLGNATAPLNTIWKALGDRLNTDRLNSIKDFLNGRADNKALKSSLESSFASKDTSTIGRILGIAKSTLILIANILVAVLEVVISILKWILGLIS